MPTSLVVKNGSNAGPARPSACRSRCRAPRSRSTARDWLPGSAPPGRDRVRPLDRQCQRAAAFAHRVARVDREVEQRRFELRPSRSQIGWSSGNSICTVTLRRPPAASGVRNPGSATTRRALPASGAGGARRPAAGGSGRGRARRPGASRASLRRHRRLLALPRMSMLPSTTVSRLLKSWATPPVSWPTASILRAWASCSSRLRRSVTSSMVPKISCGLAVLGRRQHALVQQDAVLAVGAAPAELAGCRRRWSGRGVSASTTIGRGRRGGCG